jgi:hypothetical protein
MDRVHTSREHNSLGLPCQISDLGGAGKQLSKNAKRPKPAQDKMASLRLQQRESAFVIERDPRSQEAVMKLRYLKQAEGGERRLRKFTYAKVEHQDGL